MLGLTKKSNRWIEVSFSKIDLRNTDSATNTQFMGKKVDASCKDVTGKKQNLLPGRNCNDGFQCRSGNCNLREKVCVGLEKDAGCFEDADCGQEMYCRMQQAWPHRTLCSKLRSEYELCENDSECQNY